MGCVRGKCPCWPQAEPFDAAEMCLLDAMREYINNGSARRDCLWAEIQVRSQALGRRRRAYVLSTLLAVNFGTCFKVTLLGWVASDYAQLQWLLSIGVCPSMASIHRCDDGPGWLKGPLHPGRCSDDLLYSPMIHGAADDTMHALLAAGAFPGVRTYLNTLCPHVLLSPFRRQWFMWHGRASRRLWTAAWAPQEQVSEFSV
jgi:hypothetical protein